MMDDDTAEFERKALDSKYSHPNIIGAFGLQRIEKFKTNQQKKPHPEIQNHAKCVLLPPCFFGHHVD